MDRNRLTSFLFLFLAVVVLMVFVNDRFVKSTVTTKDDCLRDQLVLQDGSYSSLKSIRGSDPTEENQIREKIKTVEAETTVVQQQLREARERVNKLELKLYESEKRLKIFQGSDKPVAPRNGSFPNFIIMGTWKGGTTSLHKMLQNHPNVCLALGEVNFFSRPTLRNIGLNLYYKFFERCLGDPKKQHKKLTKGSNIKYSTPDDIVVGEKSPTYLWNCKSVCPQIRKVNPDVKLIVSLRNPIDRAFSNWYMDWCKGVFNGTFEEFLNRSSKSLEAGVYINQMKILHEHFPKKQIFVIKTEEFFTKPRDLIHRLENYLGVDHYNFTDEDIRTYGSSPKCQKLFGSRPSVSPELKPRLLEYFKKPNAELQAFMTKEYGWGPLGWDYVHSFQTPSPDNTGENEVDGEEDEDEELSEATEDVEEEEELLEEQIV